MKIAGIWNLIVYRELLKELGVSETQLIKVAAAYGAVPEEPGDGLETVEIKLEQYQGQIYAYRLDTDQFLGQGQDRDQLISHIAQNLVNVRLIIQEENGAGLIAQD
jgi:hypothetical protein